MEKSNSTPPFYMDVRTDYGFYDMKERFLIGWPGYRIRIGKSGLTYIESVAEESHFEGLMLYWVFTGKFRTRNPLYLLFLFFIFSITAGLPLIFIMWTSSDSFPILFIPVVIFGLALFRVIWLSITQQEDSSMTGD
jgi:hypothetical protein